jgi:hypothetical protein
MRGERMVERYVEAAHVPGYGARSYPVKVKDGKNLVAIS